MANGIKAHQSIGEWTERYNPSHPHGSLGYDTSAKAYEGAVWPGNKATYDRQPVLH